MPRINVKVEGLQEAIKKLEAMRAVSPTGKLTKALVDGAEAIAASVESRTPTGPTGNLKRAIKAFGARMRAGFGPAAYTLIKRQIAAHLHLVSFGRKGFTAGTARDKVTGKRALGKVGQFGPVRRVKAQPPNPFFKEAVSASRSKAKAEIERAMKEIIERAAGIR